MKTVTRCGAVASLVLTLAGVGGCLDDSVTRGEAARIELSERGQPLHNGGELVLIGAERAEVRVDNPGDVPLELRAITVTSEPPGLLEVTAVAWPAPGAPVVVEPTGDDAGESWVFVVQLAPDAPAMSGEGLVVIDTNKTLTGERLSFAVEVVEGAPRLLTAPDRALFDRVLPGATADLELNLLNTGNAPLHIDRVELSGHPGFSVIGPDETWVTEAGSWSVDLAPPLEIAPGARATLVVRYVSEGVEAAEGALRLFSNDPVNGDAGAVVPLEANTRGPCVAIHPSRVDFGAKLVGSTAEIEVDVTSCGDEPLAITGVELVGDDDGVFALGEGAATPPASLAPGERWPVRVRYTPATAALFDAAGEPLRDVAALRVTTNALIAEIDVELRGFGTTTECPTPVIIVTEGEEVLPQTTLHLVGSQSFGPSPIAAWEWEVLQPGGSQSVLVPSAGAADPVFEANVVGTYVFRLRVWDTLGNVSCTTAEEVVFVSAGEGLHIELLWHTPNDLDETDEGPTAGADLDLHFAHAFAIGADLDDDGVAEPWFDPHYDCFWFNPKPSWGSLDPNVPDDPRLDRDDTDGAGPENLNLSQPEDGVSYRIGVHYWDDHGFGQSLATVRVYVYDTLVFEWSDMPLTHHDMWEVGSVAWPSGVVTPNLAPDEQSAVILPSYQHPQFFAP